VEQAPETSLEQIQQLPVEEPIVAQRPKATAPQGRRSIPAPSPAPPVPDVIGARSAEIDRRLSNQSPQTMILYGIINFVGGCIGAMILSTANVNSLLVGLVFLAAGLGGFVLVVLGFVLALARREGRQR
jgi:MFS family permease